MTALPPPPTTPVDVAVARLLEVQERLIEEAHRVRALAEMLRRLGEDDPAQPPPSEGIAS